MTGTLVPSRLMTRPMKPISILFITSWDRQCGVASYSRYLVNELEKHPDLAIEVFAWDYSSHLMRLLSPLLSFRRLFRALAGKDICHLQYELGIYSFLGLPVTALLCWLKRTRLLTTLHEDYHHSFLPYWIAWLHDIFYHVLDRIIVHTEQHRMSIPTRPRAHTFLVPHGVIHHAPERNPDKWTILLAGFWIPHKGYHTMIEAFSIIQKRIPQARLQIIGKVQNAAYYRNCLQRLDALGLSKHVEVLPHFIEEDTFENFFRKATLVVLPYHRVTDSGILAHVLAWGVPAVMSDLPGFRKITENGGLYVEVDNAPALSEAVIQTLSDDDLQSQMARKFRKIGEERSWQKVAQRTKDIYEVTLFQ